MPALFQKKNNLTHSISKKWNKLTTTKKVGVSVDESPVLATQSKKKKERKSSPRVQEQEQEQQQQSHEVQVVSDTSCDEAESSDDDEQDASKYGYGDASPDCEKDIVDVTAAAADMLSLNPASTRSSRRMSSSTSSHRRRRNSISTPDDNANLPFHPQRMPRRSSLKGSSPYSRDRRASIGACTMPTANATSTIIENNNEDEDDEKRIIKVQLPGRRESIKRRRSIIFNEDVNVRKITPAKTLTKEGTPDSLWFQDNEYSKIKKKCRALLQKVDANGVVDGKKYCTRGLERYMTQSAQEREGMKYGAWDSVLVEQRSQRREGTFDDENVARLYKHTSVKSVMEATLRANLDAAEVASFYDVEQPQNGCGDKTVAPGRSRTSRRASVA